MEKNYLDKLEYSEILNKLSSFCHTYIAKDLAINLMPYNDSNLIKEKLMQTMQCVNLIKQFGTAPLYEIADITMHVKSLESGLSLSASDILDISNILIEAKVLKDYFNQDSLYKDDFSSISEYFETLYSNIGITERISSCIIDANTIADNASKKLQSIRSQKTNLEQEIKDKLNSFIHSSSNSKYIQESIVTIRNDRYVIPVKEEYRTNIKGFIHDISSSGSTVFIEPISIFELNNKISDLKVEESLEIEKILQELSGLLMPYTDEIKTNVDLISKLDFIYAKAKYSISISGITPIINENKQISLINARHPLIDSSKVVPISIELGDSICTTLVITGPNTGGKTVALKTIGLLTAMACSGLDIPADEHSSIYVFDNIFADIGDNQSITESLSTFSSHMTNIAHIVNNATSNSLILVDELGSGTDPLEGANLAISILEYFNNLGSITVSTTHYQELKKYALVTPNFENASVEFDTENLMPTYRLLVGIPGKSNAFEISKKLGLKPEIIENASKRISTDDINIEDLLKTIYDNKIQIEKDKEEIEKNLNQVKLLREQLQRDNSNVKKQEEDLISNAKIKAREILLNAKEEANEIISKMNNSDSVKDLNKWRDELNSSIKSTSVETAQVQSLNPIPPEELQPSMVVYVTSFNQNGTVLSHVSKSNEVQVQIGAIKTKVNIKYLEKAKQEKSPVHISYNKTISKTKTASSEINVIGLNVEEANFVIDKFLDDSYLAKLKTVRIIHGKGTGKLRTGIHQFLKNHPHVDSFRIGTFGEGEMGATVVTIK